MKRFVVGDIHGNHRALMQCLDRSGFSLFEDQLFVIGDVVDGYPDTKKVIDTLLEIPNLVYIMGNHDYWALRWVEFGELESSWLRQGGRATLQSYQGDVPESHKTFLRDKHEVYHLTEDGMLFVHGGIDTDIPLEEQDADDMMWDRSLVLRAHKAQLIQGEFNVPDYNRIFVGHTATEWVAHTLKPLIMGNVVALDTGAGYSGALTIMDVDTLEYWQSDYAGLLYPDDDPR